GDAFGGLSPPWHLTTQEVVEDVARTLRPDGVYVLNIIDGGPRDFVRAEVATLRQVFDEVAVVVPPEAVDAPANHILVAADRPLGLDDEEVPDPDGRVLRGDAVEAFVDGARPLTDDFAPVDQLLTRR
ncbi:MAG: fused MFS/spermidine synthase, partial [Acidimicrobiia bacterium]|nr:fused MFS/spermidine synthase [Acidimicrobiia bacterium]